MSQTKQKNLTIPLPVYLDYQVVFDVLAILEDGLSQFQEVKTVYSDSSEKTNDSKAGAKVKIPLGFLSMGSGADYEHGSTKGSKNSQEVSDKKIHTSVSLFAKMRTLLQTRDLVKDDLNSSEVGDFIEFQSGFQKIEIVRVMDTLTQAVELGNKFSDQGKKTKLPKEIRSMQEVIDPIAQGLLNCVTEGDTRYLLELDKEALQQFDMERLLRGEYKVFGKVIRKEEESFNIFESTDLALMKPEALNELLSGAFSEVVQKGGEVEKLFDVPEKVPIILEGEVVIVKPIAIFV